MNISFFLRPKGMIAYLYEDTPVLQALDTLLSNELPAMPMVDRKGKYRGTVCEGDFLRLLHREKPARVEHMSVGQMQRSILHYTAKIDASMEGLVEFIGNQTFIPVTDGRGMLAGIVTRHDVLQYMHDHYITVGSA